MTSKKRADPTWSDVKAKLVHFDCAGLLRLVQDLYAVGKENQNFLHARLNLGPDVLEPYKAIIERWMWPGLNQGYSVAKAKKAIADYRKAAGQPQSLADLTVFYCEKAVGFSNEVGLDDGSYYGALCRMFEQALDIVMALPEAERQPLLDRLEDIRLSGQGIGWGVEDDLNALWQNAGLKAEE